MTARRRSHEREVRLPEQSTSDIVQSLFGLAVGPCWADDICSYRRQQGRLYLSTKAVCFYSNLFGFERRLCLLLTDVDLMELYRSTSIRICMVDGEDFVFKSLTRRESILNTLNDLKNNRMPSQLRVIELANSAEHENDKTDKVLDTLLNPMGQSSLPPTRRRTQSEPSCLQNMPKHSASTLHSLHPLEIDNQNRSRTESSGDFSSQASPEDLYPAWVAMKREDDPPYQKVVIEGMELPCSLTDFYNTLLADDAPWSIPRFQRDIIGDSEIECSDWAIDETGDQSLMRRTISFRHPINLDFGLGKFTALARREQRLRQFGTYGISLETSSFVKGVPASECFHVDDRWFLEQRGGVVLFTVKYETRFSGRTILKRLISQSTESEVLDWYKCYSKMLTEVFKGSNESNVNVEQKDSKVVLPRIKTPTMQGAPRSLPKVVLLSQIFFGLLVVMQTWYFQGQLLVLQQQIRLLREDQIQSLNQMLSILRAERG